MKPVLEWEVTNFGDVWMEYYGDEPRLSLTLYRVVGIKGDRPVGGETPEGFR